jgi:hypothetical protein
MLSRLEKIKNRKQAEHQENKLKIGSSKKTLKNLETQILDLKAQISNRI